MNEVPTTTDDDEGLQWLRRQLRWEATLDALRTGDSATVTTMPEATTEERTRPLAA